MNPPVASSTSTTAKAPGISYKYQRLREKLREAVTSGELSGRLPGERILAERFNANAKTLSKALTDLAAEGVLERIIGRGTFVKGQIPPVDTKGRWLLIKSEHGGDSEVVKSLKSLNPDAEAIAHTANLRPSFLNQFSAVIETSGAAPESFLRDLTVRNVPIVLVDREPLTFSLPAVICDLPLAVDRLAREMLLSGHRGLAAVERRGSHVIIDSLRRAVGTHWSDVVVESCEPEEVTSLLQTPATGLICQCGPDAAIVKDTLTAAGIDIPGRLSVAAVGCVKAPFPCSGYFVCPSDVAEAVAGLLRQGRPARPAVLWLAGAWHDAGTFSSRQILHSPIPQSAIRVGEMMS